MAAAALVGSGGLFGATDKWLLASFERNDADSLKQDYSAVFNDLARGVLYFLLMSRLSPAEDGDRGSQLEAHLAELARTLDSVAVNTGRPREDDGIGKQLELFSETL